MNLSPVKKPLCCLSFHPFQLKFLTVRSACSRENNTTCASVPAHKRKLKHGWSNVSTMALLSHIHKTFDLCSMARGLAPSPCTQALRLLSSTKQTCASF
ncbi:hypothetical protein XELAEV_18026497mg [Xenopus laevis]|uniref:Uncharacterized protein n=1 Tax=Xenopus laevis TaxID=8355 RepID=A0A974CTW2_XENLA|nr:hypothetical protein XELAEV_18026497mg [Xenopus laevis]